MVAQDRWPLRGSGREYTYLPERVHMITAHRGRAGLGFSGFKQLRPSCFPTESAVKSAASFSFSVFAGNANTALIPSFNEV